MIDRLAILGIAAAALLAVGFFHGQARYRAGVTDTTAAFVRADQEGASNVEQTARDTLDRIGRDFDPDELLRNSGGLRD